MIQSDNEHPFEGTCFDAAIDAAKGEIWFWEAFYKKPDPSGGSKPPSTRHWHTQRRHMERTAILVGIDPSLERRQRERIAHLLSVPGQVVDENTARLKNQSSTKAIGECICKVLNEVSLSSTISERIAEAGAIAGIWPTPIQWDSKTNSYRPLPFQQVRTRGSPA
jgi:hypothetical protein